jgi:DNA-binding NarL/FixJ family response regulator
VNRARTLLVAVSDDLLDSVVAWLADDARIEIVGRAHSGSQALDSVESLRAEVVVVDVALPDISGFEVARRLKSRAQAPVVVLLSFHDSRAARLEAWAAGADGFVPQSETADRLIPLVGDLLRRPRAGVQDRDLTIPTMRVPPAGASE